MNRRLILWSGLGGVALFAALGGAWILSLPSAPTTSGSAPISREEADAILNSLKPPKRQRPVIAIIGINDATEVTDYLMPYGVLRRSDVADVALVATNPGPVKLYPALTIEPQTTVAAFDTKHPEGADYVIVPQMSRHDDLAVLEWLRSQASKRATIVGVCAGAMIVAEAGLRDGKRATTHWYYLDKLRRKHPAIRDIADRRDVSLTCGDILPHWRCGDEPQRRPNRSRSDRTGLARAASASGDRKSAAGKGVGPGP